MSVVVPLLEGLAAVHGDGVLHRDIKPANIVIRISDQWPVLIDFGAAKQAVAEQSRSMVPYTEGYAAIEQVGEGDLGPWTDLYGLGGVMWRMVAGGNPPWQPPNPRRVERRLQAKAYGRQDPLPPASELGAGRFSRRTLEAIDRCLRVREEERVGSCEELLCLLGPEGGGTTPSGAAQPRGAGYAAI